MEFTICRKIEMQNRLTDFPVSTLLYFSSTSSLPLQTMIIKLTHAWIRVVERIIMRVTKAIIMQ